MRTRIPKPVAALLSEAISASETHASLANLFGKAGAPGEPPTGATKTVKAQLWLKLVNDTEALDPLQVLGRLLEDYIEPELDSFGIDRSFRSKYKDKILRCLESADLEYRSGGRIVAKTIVAAPSRSLEQLIRDRDLGAVNEEFERALESVEAKPRDAVSAASNILEAVCKVYIEDEEHLAMPKKRDLKQVWSLVRQDLGFDPKAIEDDDLKKILTGLFSIVDGVAALRTHASSAHSPGRKTYRVQPRHARLAVHAAHTAASFVLESWDQKASKK